MEKVLVLLATYNGEKYLQEQLDSLYMQEEVDVHILVRDDGSTDSTIDILEENSKNHNLDWYQGDHKNVSKSFFELMQKGAETKYELFAFCDQDDVWDSNKLKIAVERINKVNTMALYYCGQRLVNDQRVFIENHELNKNRTLKTRFVMSDFAGCTGVFNKKLLEEVIKYEPAYMLMHDTWIMKVCLCLGGSVYIDTNPRMDYRQHDKNTLGLGHSFKATIKQIDQYINEYQVEKVTKELLNGYGNRMVPEYKEICSWICKYKRDWKCKKKLLDRNNVDFCKFGLNIVFCIKVILNKL